MRHLHVLVTTIDTIAPHPNADRLDIATVGGWQCVVGRDEWTPGERCVFIPPDSILPPDLSDELGVTQYLRNGRVKHTRLRGETSFGLVIRPQARWPVGTDVADAYGITKYEPPQRDTQCKPRTGDPRFFRYTDIDNLRHYTDSLDGTEVHVTEKIHGANSRIGVLNGKLLVGSRRLIRGRPDGAIDTSGNDVYWVPYAIPGVRDLLAHYQRPWWKRLFWRGDDIILFGEIYGPGIQSMTYGRTTVGYAAFDLMINKTYIDYTQFLDICATFDIPVVPYCYGGSYSLDRIRELSRGPSFFGGIREGVVVRPVKETWSPIHGRMIFKYLSDDYLLSTVSDSTDV